MDENEKKPVFLKLTPTKDTDLKIYEDALNFAFEHEDIKNVALSGAYGAGKSSVLESYKDKYPTVNFLHISLAHFHSTNQEGFSSANEKIESLLEGKILNQLIHQIDPEDIPLSQFKVKHEVSIKRTLKIAVPLMILMILLVYMNSFTKWNKFICGLLIPSLKSRLMWTTNSMMLLIAGIICFFITGVIIYKIIESQLSKNILKKITLQGNEIEIFTDNSDSYFDKYLNDVLYLFKNSKADAIVFEDMDRFDENQIFEKLREVNTLINKRCEKTIRFIYLIRDDMFVSKDRTKFFDYIIPIVPIVDGSNSYDKLIEYFNTGSILELFDLKFLQGLSLYIDDMRFLKNIYNEFIIYHNRIQSTELNNNRLLAMIVYKNIFPRDFSDLQLGMGYVYTLFESKPLFIEKAIQKIDIKIKEYEKSIQKTNGELVENIDELDAIFLKTNEVVLHVAGQQEASYETRAAFIRAMKDHPNSIQTPGYNYSWQNYDIKAKFKELSNNPSYIKRKKLIERKSNEYVEGIKIEIQKLEKQKVHLQNERLKEICIQNDSNEIFGVNYINELGETDTFSIIKASPYFPLIKYLIRNGHIDESYHDYMTYFYPNSLSSEDKIFLRSVSDEIPKDYYFMLKNHELVLSRLRESDFDHKEILNFDLLIYLLKTKEENKSFLIRFLKQLYEGKKYKFISQFLDTSMDIGEFVKEITPIWPDLFDSILKQNEFREEQRKNYALNILYSLSDSDILLVNESGSLSSYISNNAAFLDISMPNIDKIISGLIILEVRFEALEYGISHKDLLAEVYKSNLYNLNFKLISFMLISIYGLPQNDDFNNKNYTLIMSRENEPLALYVNQQISNYMNIILENCNGSIGDEEWAALLIINNETISKGIKEKYIMLLQHMFFDINSILDIELWPIFLLQRKIAFSEKNILSYFYNSKNGLDTVLVEFINTKQVHLHFDNEDINKTFGENASVEFNNAVISCNELDNIIYENILDSLDMMYAQFSYKGIHDDKITILISLNAIPITELNLDFMRKNYQKHTINFITRNITEYLTIITNPNNFVLSEMLRILEENIRNNQKIKLLQLTRDPISIKQNRYSEAIKKHILEHNFDEGDTPFLIRNFTSESNSIKEIILKISSTNIKKIIAEQYSIPNELLSRLLLTGEFSVDIKKEILVLGLSGLTDSQAKEHFTFLQMDDFSSLFEGKRPKFEVNEINKKILDIFENRKWITRFDIDREDPNYYRAIGRRL